MSKLYFILAILITTASLHAQNGVSINTSGENPDSSAMLDIQSTDKGLLIPRMTTAQKLAITDPATGLMVFDTDQDKFYCYANGEWVEVMSDYLPRLTDADNDTKIQVEESPDEDLIRFDLLGTERWRMTGQRLEPHNGANSVYIGRGAGSVPAAYSFENVAIGDSVMKHSNGVFNVAIGAEAMKDNLNGSGNVALGKNSLTNNQNGSHNVAIGPFSMVLNSTGTYNVAIGRSSLYHNVSGYGNIGIGLDALGLGNNDGDYNIALGRQSMGDNTAGNYNVAIGRYALSDSYAQHQQVAIGDSALNFNGSDFFPDRQYYNTVVGAAAFANSDTGAHNTALGYHAGKFAIGSSNVFLGFRAGENATGNHKLYISNSSTNSPLIYGEFNNSKVRVNGSFETPNFVMNGPRLAVNGSGSSVFIGTNAGENDDLSGNNNVFIGRYTGRFNTSGHWNTALGHTALMNCTTGNRNVAIGGVALRDNNGARNVAIGVDAGRSNTGDHNIFIGFEAGKNNTGSGNVFLGNNAGETVAGSDRLFIDNTNDATPLIYGEFDNDMVRINGELQLPSGTGGTTHFNYTDGYNYIRGQTRVDDPMEFRGGTDATLSPGSGYMVVGNESSTNIVLDNNEIMARNNGANSELLIQTDGGDVRVHGNKAESQQFMIKNNGRVGIGENEPAFKLDVRDHQGQTYVAQILNTSTSDDGHGLRIEVNSEAFLPTHFIGFYDQSNIVEGSISGVAGNAVAYNTTSDRRLKTNIETLENGLETVRKMRPATYQWKSDGAEDFGFVAQELKEVIPNAVSGRSDSDPATNPMGVDYGRVTPILTAAIQELLVKVEGLEKRVAELENSDVAKSQATPKAK